MEYRKLGRSGVLVSPICLGTMNFGSSTTEEDSFVIMQKALQGARKANWINLGGQLVPQEDVDQLRADIASGTLDSWEAIHQRYDSLWQSYR